MKRRIGWLGGVLGVWTLVWVVMGVRFALLMGKTPHPFLPSLSYTGIMLKAVAGWAAGAWAAYLMMGLVTALIALGLWHLGRPKGSPAPLGFGHGAWVGLGAVLLTHGWLYLQVPVALATVQGLRWLPMGLVMALCFGLGLGALARGLAGPGEAWRSRWLRALGAGVVMGLLLLLPHDLFRRFMPRPAPVPAEAPRVLVVGLDGTRQDVLEKVRPEWKAPEGVHPVVAVPATRLTWNMLLGADPEKYLHAFVIPFRSEFDEAPATRTLTEAKGRGLSTAFLIDDCTTLTFGLTRNDWGEVLEPYGGWKHFFTVGAGTCWPVYSWLENYVSPVETTNPWSDVRAFYRDIDRTLGRHHATFAHTCQLHAPTFLRREEIQVLRPWSWLIHPAWAYECYQSYHQAEQDKFRRVGGRANPQNHYRIRLARITAELNPFLARWTARYPNLSGMLTSDHGTEFSPVIRPDDTLITYLAGVHGFSLNADSLRVPLHPFGRTVARLEGGAVFSWFDLRDNLWAWVEGGGKDPLVLKAGEGPWHLRFPTVQARHTQASRDLGAPADSHVGIRPEALARATYLMPIGIWMMDNAEAPKNPVLSRALVYGERIVTFNPVGKDEWWREETMGYRQVASDIVNTETMEKEVAAFQGRVPQPLPNPAPGRP